MLTVSITLTSSSRATIAAGTRPPRGMAPMALNGPDEASRQANARASLWNWSHETGKALSRGEFTGGSFAKDSPFLTSAMTARDLSWPRINTFCNAGSGRRLTRRPVLRQLRDHSLDGATRHGDRFLVLAAHHDLVAEAPVLKRRIGADRHVRMG